MHDLTTAMTSPKGRVIRLLRDQIASGVLPPGATIPTEKMLSDQLDVSREAVRSAYEKLQIEGVIRVVGTGRVVCGLAVAMPVVPRSNCILIADGHRAPSRAGHTLAALDERLRNAGFSPKRMSMMAAPEACARMAADQPVALIGLCDQGVDQTTAKVLDACSRVPRVVLVPDAHDPLVESCDVVTINHAVGGSDLVDWLVEQKRHQLQRVWHEEWSGGPIPSWLLQRDEGMCLAAAAHGLELLPIISLPWCPTAGLSEAARWRLDTFALAGALASRLFGAQPCDGLLMLHDRAALQAWAALGQLGAGIPDRVLVTGHDATWDDPSERKPQMRPPSATIAWDLPAVGEALADLVLARLDGTAPSARQIASVPPMVMMSG